MAQAVVQNNDSVTLHLSKEEASNLFELLSVHSVVSSVDTYPIYSALDDASKYAVFLDVPMSQVVGLLSRTRVTSGGLFEIVRP